MLWSANNEKLHKRCYVLSLLVYPEWIRTTVKQVLSYNFANYSKFGRNVYLL